MIDKAWIGEEQEGVAAKGCPTLFVEGARITNKDIYQIMCLCHEHGVKRVYLGANCKDVKMLGTRIDVLNKQLCVVVETSDRNEYVSRFIKEELSIIYRIERHSLKPPMIAFKVNVDKECYMYDMYSHNSFSDCVDGLYGVDKEINLKR